MEDITAGYICGGVLSTGDIAPTGEEFDVGGACLVGVVGVVLVVAVTAAWPMLVDIQWSVAGLNRGLKKLLGEKDEGKKRVCNCAEVYLVCGVVASLAVSMFAANALLSLAGLPNCRRVRDSQCVPLSEGATTLDGDTPPALAMVDGNTLTLRTDGREAQWRAGNGAVVIVPAQLEVVCEDIEATALLDVRTTTRSECTELSLGSFITTPAGSTGYLTAERVTQDSSCTSGSLSTTSTVFWRSVSEGWRLCRAEPRKNTTVYTLGEDGQIHTLKATVNYRVNLTAEREYGWYESPNSPVDIIRKVTSLPGGDTREGIVIGGESESMVFEMVTGRKKTGVETRDSETLRNAVKPGVGFVVEERDRMATSKLPPVSTVDITVDITGLVPPGCSHVQATSDGTAVQLSTTDEGECTVAVLMGNTTETTVTLTPGITVSTHGVTAWRCENLAGEGNTTDGLNCATTANFSTVSTASAAILPPEEVTDVCQYSDVSLTKRPSLQAAQSAVDVLVVLAVVVGVLVVVGVVVFGVGYCLKRKKDEVKV